jgi:hypothetical protein
MLKNFMAVWNILRTFGIFYEILVHFVLIWYIFPVLVYCTKKNLATLTGAVTHGVAPVHIEKEKKKNRDQCTVVPIR